MAYYALPHTMDGAIFLGSIQLRFETKKRKDAFMNLMREAVGDILKEVTGARPTWPNPEGQPAPEHERGGNA